MATANEQRQTEGTRQEQETDRRDAEKTKRAGTKLLVALEKLDPDRNGVTKKKVRELAKLSGRDMTCAVTDLIEQVIIEEIPVVVTFGNNAKQTCEGIRRRTAGTAGTAGENSGSPTVPNSGTSDPPL